MIHRRLRFVAACLSLLLVGSALAVPAFAAEENGTAAYTNSGSNGTVSFPEPPAPPTPTPVPTPEPTPVPTPEPTPEPTTEPSQPDDPTPPPNDDPNTPDDNEDPTPNQNGGGTVRPAATPTPVPSVSPRPTGRPGQSEQPTVSRPKVPLHTQDSSSQSAETDGSNYVTFAQLNVKNNSMSVTLFYGGVICAILGGAGLVFLLVRFLRGRRRDNRAEVLEKVRAAESLQPPRAISSTPELVTAPPHRLSDHTDPASQSHPHSVPPRQPAHPVPARAQLSAPHATHEALSQQPSVPQSARPDPNGPIMPVQASMYTEEFSLPEGPSQSRPPMAERLRQSVKHSDQPAEKSKPSTAPAAVQEPVQKPAASPAPASHGPVQKELRENPPSEKTKQEKPPEKTRPADPSEPEPQPDGQLPGQLSLLDPEK